MWLDFSPVRDSLWVGVSLLECPRQLLVSTLRLLGDKGIMLSDSRQFSAKTMHTHKNTHTQIHTEMSTHAFLIFTQCNECYYLYFLHLLSLYKSTQSFYSSWPAAWHLTYIRAELLDGCLDAVDLLGQPAVQSPLRHGLGVQSLQTAGDSLEHWLVALSRDINTRAAGKKRLSGVITGKYFLKMSNFSQTVSK